MKTNIKREAPPVPKFVPVTIALTLETAEEVQALYDVGNHSHMVASCMQKHTREVNVDAVVSVTDNLYRAIKGLFGAIGHCTQRLA